MDTVKPRHLLFLVGMHRSGTSALCAALNACGASFGADLLEPMERVNERGFWESSRVVAINERLLHVVGVEWYSVTSEHLDIDWDSLEFQKERSEAVEILRSGFGDGTLEAVKDPRFCITLPFWLSLCEKMGLRVSVCVMTRSAMEVCRSLEERDGFPPGYGIRLLRTYMHGITKNVPSGTLYASYERLLADPTEQLREMGLSLPLTICEENLGTAVHGELRHQTASEADARFSFGDRGEIGFDAFDAQIQALFPIEQTLSQMADRLVYRGRELTRIGEFHTQALKMLDKRDAELSRLAAELDAAAATVEQRDAEHARLDMQLQQLGELHTHALVTVRKRDQQLEDFGKHLQEIGDLHNTALQVIEERDEQSKRFGAELQQIGDLHSKALEVIREKEAHIVTISSRLADCEADKGKEAVRANEVEARLQRVFRMPVFGFLFRMILER